MDKTMGNQQVTPTELAWLAGIWDGEGTFGIYRYKQTSNGKWSYSGRLTLSNTSKEMISEIERIFNLLEVKVSLWQAKKGRKENHKLEVHLTLNRMKEVKLICEKLQPYIVAKKERLLLLLEFVNSRLGYKRVALRDEKTGYILGIKEQGYLDYELLLYGKMRQLNQVGVGDTSETLRQDSK